MGSEMCIRDSAGTELVADAASLPAEQVALRVELVVVVAQVGDVHQAVDEQLVERDEEAEARHAAHGAFELVAHMVLHLSLIHI